MIEQCGTKRLRGGFYAAGSAPTDDNVRYLANDDTTSFEFKFKIMRTVRAVSAGW